MASMPSMAAHHAPTHLRDSDSDDDDNNEKGEEGEEEEEEDSRGRPIRSDRGHQTSEENVYN